MKKLLFAVVIAQLCGLQLIAQESSVKILLNEEERFRFVGEQIKVNNPGHNVIIGDSTGSNSEAFWNVIIGHKAGGNLWNGYRNVFIGNNAGLFNSSGTGNTFVGYNTGYQNSTGVGNTFIGDASGRSNNGEYNTYLGHGAGRLSENGEHNTYVGVKAGNNNYQGSHNLFVGSNAGFYNNGNNNVFIGYCAGQDDTGSYKLIISGSNPSDPPLIYGEFDNKILRFNAGRMEIKNPLGNTIIGDSSGTQVSGDQNVLVGAMAGKALQGGSINTYIGYKAGSQSTSGHRNTFVGTFAGFSNISGFRNVFVGLSAGYANTTGSYNTYLGRISGYNNETGNSNVFIGNAAGQNEMGSQKLYISNSETSEPLIYGDFAKNKLRFHADTVQATGVVQVTGEIRSDLQYNIKGNPGVTDTVNSVTTINFTENKLKYRTIIYNGGIATYVSPESGWTDAVGEYFTPCGMISIIGEFTEWEGDQNMTRDPYNPDLWSTTVQFTGEDDCHPAPCDSIIKVKFREDASWDVNWGSTGFPSGTGIQGGDSIPVPLDKVNEPTIFYVTFNCKTGEYAFTDLSGYCPDSITDIRDDKKYATVLIGSQCWMAQNLNVGTQIDSTTTQTDNELIEKYCYHDLESNCTQWGGLYQWNELMGYVTTPAVQGICPAGFHVPTDAEFKILEGNVDSQFGPGSVEWNKTLYRGYDAGYNIRSTEGWSGSGNGSDAFGFHALPGGYLTDYGDGQGYYDSGCCNCYPTSTAGTPDNTYNIRYMNGNAGNQIERLDNNMIDDGLSLRCLKD